MNQSAEERANTSHQELLRRAEALVPTLRERAAETEDLRRVPDATWRDLHDSGLLRLLQPKRVGGAELDFWHAVQIEAVLARGCASTSWNFCNIAIHHWMLAMWPPEAQEQLWGENPDVLICSSLAYPAGRAERVEGGYMVQGKWPFSSAIDPCTWGMFAAMVQGEGGRPAEHRMFLVPDSAYEIFDTWHAMGLRGTGSNDVAVQPVFVPEQMTADPRDWQGRAHAGSALNPGPLYRLPAVAIFPYCLNGVALGVAEGALEDYLRATRERAGTYTGGKVADYPTVQVKVAEAAVLIDTARLVMKTDCEQAMGTAQAGKLADMDTKVRYRRNGAYVVKLCTQAVDLLFAATGGAALYEKNPLQRAFRDIHAVAAHISFTWEPQAITTGRHMLGLPVDNPLL